MFRADLFTKCKQINALRHNFTSVFVLKATTIGASFSNRFAVLSRARPSLKYSLKRLSILREFSFDVLCGLLPERVFPKGIGACMWFLWVDVWTRLSRIHQQIQSRHNYLLLSLFEKNYSIAAVHIEK